MKYIAGLLLLAIAVVEISCSRKCKAAEDCLTTQCCVIEGSPYRTGECQNLAKEGRRCSEPEAKLDYHGGKFYGRCPCQEGLECLPRTLEEEATEDPRLHKVERLRCQRPPTTDSHDTTDPPNSGESGRVSHRL